MTWFVESIWPGLILGLAIETVLAVLWMQGARRAIAAAMALVAAATLGLIIIERLVVTRTEEVEDLLDEAARTLVANDPPRLLELFSPDSPRRKEVQSTLAHVKVREAHVGGDLEISFNDHGALPTATAVFTGRIDAQDTTGRVPYEHMLGRFRVTLRREGDRWRIYDYTAVDTRGRGPGP
ncbi:MAG TPA: hypothetical protein VHX39_10515 [Acetobacteraceae bacterium]|jgi:hypothetical protein|nr:hypothetical protein [Acetobacteraceae bacterium]